MSDHERDAALPAGIAQLFADPTAPHWAQECAWVPGTGHCRNRSCGAECLFHPQRIAEAARVERARRARRPAQRTLGNRMVRLAGVLRATLAARGTK